jgi:epoxyqueuosine reductase QueG
LKEKAIELGASVVGIAHAGRIDEAPEGHKSTDILDDATSVISIGVAQPRAVIQRSMPTQYTRNIFSTAGIGDGIASRMNLWIEGQGFDTIPISARFMYMDALSGVFRGDLSHKHTAMLAGLGEIGIHSRLINPTYGTRLKLVSVVTNSPVQPDSPFTESLFPRSECMECVTACPVKAINSSGAIDKEKCAKYLRRYPDI